MFINVDGVNFTHMAGTPFATPALRHISFTVERGEFIGLIGSSGAGKTTMVQLITGLMVPDSGEIYLDGVPAVTSKISGKEWRKKLGLVFQHPEQQLFAESVYQDVAFGPRNLELDESEVKKRVEESLQLVKLDYEKVKDLSPFSLSGGEMRRVALAGVIAMKPEALVLDEPTAGLDPRGREEFLSFVKKLHEEEGMTIILVSHRMDDVARFASRLMVFHQGELVLNGSKEEVFEDRERLQEFGLEQPSLVLLMEKLRSRGKEVRTGVFTVEETVEELQRFFNGGS